MVPLNWGDELTMRVWRADQIDIELECGGDIKLPEGSNLAFRAAQAFCQRFEQPLGIQMRLMKKVPTGAGLGGGSSDAGTVLRLLAQFCGFKRERVLSEMAACLGSDVPFFLKRESAWCEGRGEICKSVHLPHQLHFVLVHSPESAVSTPWAYQQLDIARSRSHPTALELLGKPRWLKRSWTHLPLENDFEAIVLERRPQLRRVSKALCQVGASGVRMTGSGASFFGLFETAARARQAAQKLVSEGFWAHSCSSLK
jgi:4-diphosphocytidyl-2-C-methyl-D-erythritol kinase